MNIMPVVSRSVYSDYTKSQNFKGTSEKEINNPNTANIVDIGGGGRIGKSYLYAYIMGKHAPVKHSMSTMALAPQMKVQNLVAVNMGSMGLKEGQTIDDVNDEDLLANITNDSVLHSIPPTVKLSIKHDEDNKAFLHIESRRGGKEDIELVATRNIVDFSEYKPDILVNTTGAKPELTSDGLRKYKEASGLTLPETYALLSAPSKEKVKDDSERPFGEKNMPMIVVGVTDRTSELEQKSIDNISAAGNIVSAASCTTNGSASATDILKRNFGIKCGFVETVHAVTSTQPTADKTKAVADSKNRNPFNAIVPTSTGAAKALAKTVPGIEKGTLDGTSWRVPVSDGSLAVMNYVLEKPATVDEINALFRKEAAKKQNRWLLGIAPKNSTSADVVGNPIRDLINLEATKVVKAKDGTTMAHVESYYDNEWGYTVGLATLASTIALKKVIPNKLARGLKAVVK